MLVCRPMCSLVNYHYHLSDLLCSFPVCDTAVGEGGICPTEFPRHFKVLKQPSSGETRSQGFLLPASPSFLPSVLVWLFLLLPGNVMIFAGILNWINEIGAGEAVHRLHHPLLIVLGADCLDFHYIKTSIFVKRTCYVFWKGSFPDLVSYGSMLIVFFWTRIRKRIIRNPT
jgi:hypothetical protein